MRLDRFLHRHTGLGHKTLRRSIASGLVVVNGTAINDPRYAVTPFCRVELEGSSLQAREALYIMLHKPCDCISSRRPEGYTTVFDLIDHPQQSQLHYAGRLDVNTSGLMLFSNDSGWTRAITAPDKQVNKRYRVATRDAISAETRERFAEGIYLPYEACTTGPAVLNQLDSHLAELSITEGKYHQIKRMFAAVGNQVKALHRLSIGALQLDPNLAPRQWRVLTAEEANLALRAEYYE